MQERSKIMAAAVVSAWVILAVAARAARLEPDGWSAADSAGNSAAAMLDGDSRTSVVSRGNALEPRLLFTIDLGKPHLLHRVFGAGGRGAPPRPEVGGVGALEDLLEDGADLLGGGSDDGGRGSFPRQIAVYVGDKPDTKHRVGTLPVPEDEVDVGTRLHCDFDLRFPPTVGRYVTLVAGEDGRGHDWHVAELELYGSAEHADRAAGDAIVVEPEAPAVLRSAAEELSYYLTELTGRGVPVIPPAREGDYPGTLYVLEDLAPLAPDWATMQANREAGLLPEGVNVERRGRKVVFRAWPYRNTRYSVWEFLRRQGVLWVYPGPHGDTVPAGQGVNLDILPLRYTPSSPRRYVSFAVGRMSGQAYLYWWRNGYDETWAHRQMPALGGREMPPPAHPPLSREERPPDYEEGFDAASPHTLATAVPWRIVEQHADWKGRYPDGRVVPGTTCCPTAPGVIDFVVRKILAISADPESRITVRLTPMDACSWCLCERCQELDGPPVWQTGRSRPVSSFSESYFHFINEVAKRVIEERPHVLIQALAYSRHYEPPRRIERFPDNVRVQVLVYGARYLPMDSPANDEARAVWRTWREKVAHLAYYDHFLLHPGRGHNETRPTLPVPGIAAIVSRARFLESLDALWGEVEGDIGSIPYNPWNYYAYPRLLWDVSLAQEDVMQEFFPAYFAEAADPMLAYYRALEQHLVGHDIDCRGADPGVYALPVVHELGKHLAQAEAAAAYWLTRERVAAIRDGYDELRNRLGMAGRDLSDTRALPHVGPQSGGVRIAGDQLSVQQDYVSRKDDSWFFAAHGRLGAYVAYGADGEYTVELEARAKPADEIYPILTLLAGRHRSEPVTIASTDYKPYTFVVQAEAGIWLTALDYRNAASGGARNIFVRNIRIAPGKRVGGTR